jgi:valyl-tRNA synthetase
MNTEGKDLDHEKALEFSLADRWIRSALQATVKKVHDYFQQYRFDLIAQTLYEFVWNEYCDWYVELAKCRLLDSKSTPAQLRGARLTLLEVLEKVLRLMHPIMPFITEEIWQKVAPLVDKTKSSITLMRYPLIKSKEIDHTAEQAIEWLKHVVVSIRTIRAEMGINPGKMIPVLFHKGNTKDHEYLNWLSFYIKSLAKVSDCEWAKNSDELRATATAVVDQLEIHIPLSGIIDKNAELDRLNKEINKLKKEVQQSSSKLANADYINKAPKAVVTKEQERLQLAESTLEKLLAQQKNIEAL